MSGKKIYIDPGPGAVVWSAMRKINLRNLSGLVISHCHPDHYTDAEVVIESMTNGARSRRGFLITTAQCMNSADRRAVSEYHCRALDEVIIMKGGDIAKAAGLKITATPGRHREAETIGLVFEAGSEKLGYVSDTEYISGMEKYFEGCGLMVINILRPRGSGWPGHMNVEDAAKMLMSMKAKPLKAVIQHFGNLMLDRGPEKEAAWLEKETGVKIVAAADGMTVEA